MSVLVRKAYCGRKQAAFSLLELLMVLALASLVLFLLVPSVQSFFINNRIRSMTSDLSMSLRYARGESMGRVRRVAICSTSEVQSALPSCDQSDWSAGWLVFIDSKLSGQPEQVSDVLRVYPAAPAGIQIRSSDGAHSAFYRPTGQADAARSWTICQTGYSGRMIQVLAYGQIQVLDTGSCA